MSFLTVLLERAAGLSGEGTVKTVIDWLVVALFLFLMRTDVITMFTVGPP